MKPSQRIREIADKNNVFLRDDWQDNHTREFQWIKHILTYLDEFCPHCGYYCNGKSVFCTKGK